MLKKLSKLSENKYIPYIVIAFASFIISIVFFTMNLSEYNEARIHIVRIVSIKEVILDKIFPCFISQKHMLGFGYALNIFYGPLTTYIPILISFSLVIFLLEEQAQHSEGPYPSKISAFVTFLNSLNKVGFITSPPSCITLTFFKHFPSSNSKESLEAVISIKSMLYFSINLLVKAGIFCSSSSAKTKVLPVRKGVKVSTINISNAKLQMLKNILHLSAFNIFL